MFVVPISFDTWLLVTFGGLLLLGLFLLPTVLIDQVEKSFQPQRKRKHKPLPRTWGHTAFALGVPLFVYGLFLFFAT